MEIHVLLEFGDKEAQEIGKKTKEELKKSWGWNGEDKSWDTWIIVSTEINDAGYIDNMARSHEQLKITLMKYCTSEEEWNELKETLNIDDETKNPELDFSSRLTKVGEVINKAGDKIEGGYNWGKSAVKGTKELVTNFAHNPKGTLITLLLDLLRAVFGDFPQFVANMIQTPSDHTFFNWHYMYSRDDIESDVNLNKYIDVGDYNKGDSKEWQKVIDIEKEDDDDKSFDNETEIPVMTGDLYNLAVGHVSFLDANILTGNKDHDEGSPWMIMRNFAATLIHITIYIAGAIILITLIIFGVQVVKNSFNNPEEEAEYKKRLESFSTSVAMLIGSVAIMGLCIFGSKSLFNSFEQRENTELPIRVNVELAGYSFSTTAAGYVRYMAGIEDVDRWEDKGFYTFSFIALAIINLSAVVLMLIRMIALWVLGIIGPLSAALNVFGLNGIMNFRTWAIVYIILSMIQAGISLIYQIALYCAIE